MRASADRLLTLARAWLRWIIALGLVVIAGAGYWAYQSYQAAQAKAQALAALNTEVVTRGDIPYSVSATGFILPERQSSLFFLSPGTVVEVLVKSGDRVRAGQILARLDAATLVQLVAQAEDALAVAKLNRQKLLAGPDPGDVAVAQANVRSANATAYDLARGAGPEEINIAQIQYDTLQSAYQETANNYNNTIAEADQGLASTPSENALERLKLSMEGAFYAAEMGRLQLEVLKNGADPGTLSVAYAQIKQAQAALAQLQAPPTELQIQQADLVVAQAQLALDQAQLQLSRAELRAPYAGTIAAVNTQAGDLAGTTSPAVVLIDADRFYLEVAVNEIDVAQVSIGQNVSLAVDALAGVPLTGKVERVAPAAAVVEGVVNYSVRILLDSSDAPLRTGMSATAEIHVALATNVLRVPNWAIRRDRRTGQVYVSLKIGEQLVETPITAGLRGEEYTEGVSGVQAGDVAAVSVSREPLELLGGP